jgi:Leucine-rich repeat (LRR) protein
MSAHYYTCQVLHLASLEILDLSHNRIRVLPEGIGNLTSLTVLAISRNKIERLPLSLGDLRRLRLLKFEENPLIFPPPEVYAPESGLASKSNPNEEIATATMKIMIFLKKQNKNGFSGTRGRAITDVDGQKT